MIDHVGNFCILDEKILSIGELGEVNPGKQKEVYEVIRIINSVPLFFEDHYERLKNSLNFMEQDIKLTEDELRTQIRSLIDENGQKDCNVKVIVYYGIGEQHCLLYISKSYYPVQEEILKGVPLSLFQWERENPNVKMVNHRYKEEVSKKIKEDNVFEVLLVNSSGQITEGSRSNVFFVKGNRVYTAPEKFVLKGITRQYVLTACRNAGLEVIEELIGVERLKEIEGVFLSGTSIKVLSVSHIDNFRFESGSHPSVTAARDEYDRILIEYIESHR